MVKALVLAAGRGSRLKELTAHTPKPLVPVAGVKPLLRTIDLLHHAGINNICVNAYYLVEKVIEGVASFTPPITVIIEDEVIDNGGGVKNALPFLGEAPFLAINGDLIWLEEQHPILAALPQFFDPARMDGLLLLIPLENTHGYTGKGDFMLAEDGRLSWPTSGQAPKHVYGGIQVLHPRIFAPFTGQKKFALREVYENAVKRGRLFGHIYQGHWADMGTPEGFAAAAQLLAQIPPKG